MSTSKPIICIYCEKECKLSDSRPYPNSKSNDRIHNKCLIKKNLADKKQQSVERHSEDGQVTKNSILSSNSSTSFTVLERVAKEESDLKKAESERKLSKLIENHSKQAVEKAGETSIFFDLKAGIAKPNEKHRYLHHRNLCEIAARYDDHGFKEEAVGRAYDHSGKDLNTLGDDEEEDEAAGDSPDNTNRVNSGNTSAKRKSHPSDDRSSNRLGDGKNQRVKLDEKNPCWFCLSSPKVEKHLIIAIGEFCYLTLAKGGLSNDHLLLIPIEHIQSINDNDGNSVELLNELEKFKLSLVDYFGSQSKGVVFFERNFRSVHWQLQIVPLPLDIIDTIEENIKTLSKVHFKNSDYLDIPQNCTLSDMIPRGVPYFFWQIEPIGSRFVTQIQVKGSFFPIQLGRLILADEKILNCPDKVDWKSCTKTNDEYDYLVKETKKRYKNFDVT